MPTPEKPLPLEEDEKKKPLIDPIIAKAQTLQFQSEDGVYSDVNGSYTGTPVDSVVPEQDADDL